ncbi:MAG TPA: TonB-dependent receptor [Thermoanaerobaculia bacterium]|nr:TonB-dependent receptor [Thermoanaerobaculia bacterium]
MTKLSSRLVLAFIVLLFPALLHAQQAVVSGRVTIQADGSPLPGATVSINELNLITTTDSEGRYSFDLPSSANNTVTVTVEFQGFQKRSSEVRLSGGAASQDFALRVSFGQEITVGSRAIGTANEKAVPVDVITEEQIESVGASETSQVIQALAPSFNFPRPTITDGTDSVRPATLRGLGPDQMLVLINGKRRHNSALVNVNNSVGRGSTGVDMNAIPASALANIEVLRDGASAQYGSDAIAGVINLVLKSGSTPWTFNLKAGATTHGDGELIDASLSKGFAVGNGSIFGTIEFRDRAETNRAGNDPREQVRKGDGGNNAVPQPNHHWGDSEAKDIIGLVHGQLPLNDQGSNVLYGFGLWGQRKGSHGGFYRRAIDPRNRPEIYPLGFLPLIEPEVEDRSFTVGNRGQLRGWFYDLSGQYGDNSFDFNLTNTLNTSLGPSLSSNQTEFYAGSLKFGQFVGNFDISRPYNFGLAGPVNVAAGIEFRRENFEQIAGERNSYIDGGVPNQFGGRSEIGSQVFPGYRPSNAVDVSRNSKALYVDLEGDVLQRLRMGLAARYEDFDDFGSTSDGKLTVRFEPVKRIVLRGAASTGFRAPSLAQSHFSSTSTTFLNLGGVLTPFEVATFTVRSAQAQALGAKPLRPEESKQLSVGAVWDPVPTFELAVDFYKIDINDRVVLSGNFTGPRIEALLRPLGANGGRFFTNAIDTETNGFDIVSTWKIDTGSVGNFIFSGSYNRNETDVVSVADTPPQLAGFEAVLFDRVVRRLTECAQPADNLRLSAEWQRSRFGGNIRNSRYGEYCSFTNPAASDQTFSQEWLTDFELSYKWDRYTLALGAQNVFDQYPDLNIGPDSNLGIFTYPRNSPFGMNGRFIYSRISLTF